MSAALAPTTQPLVDASWLADHVDDPRVRIVEVDVSAAAYDRGHVPGAVLWNAYADLRHPDYTPLTRGELEQLFRRAGVGPETTLAFYGYAAHLGYWLAQAHGHEAAALLDAPRDRWPGPWATDARAPEPTRYRLAPAARVVTRAELLELDAVVLDVRSEAEFVGDRFWPSDAPEERGRAGHVRGAVNLPIAELRSETGFRSRVELEAALRQRAVTPDRRVVVYCTIGNRASQAWYALTHLLGFGDVAVYDGGWAEWGSDPTSPVER